MPLSPKTPSGPSRFASRAGEPPIQHPAVCESDPHHPPDIPLGAKARAITNADGRVICFVWVSPEIPDDVIDARCYDFMDGYEPMTRTNRPRLLKD